MLQILFFIFLGIFVGLIAGILPGIHPNQVFVALISMLPLLSNYPNSALLAFILSVAVSNVLFNYIPTLFFSLPDSSTVMNILPGHRMVLKGEGMDALFISILSAFAALILSSILLPVLLFVIPIIHEALYSYLHFLLIGLTLWMIMIERTTIKKIQFLILFILSGLWGILTLNSMLIDSGWVLFPSLTGMFGLAGLLMSVQEVKKIPSQIVKKNVKIGSPWKILLSSLIAGLLIGVLPGAGESQAGVLVSQFTKLSQKEFLGSLAGINSSNLFFSIISLYSFGKIRSGTGAAITEVITDFNLNWLLFSVGVIIFSGGLSVLLTWYIGKKMLKFLERVNYDLISKVIIIFTLGMIVWFTGIVGVFITVVSTCLGLLPILWGVKRSSNMGYLMLPTIIYFIGITHVINMTVF